MAILRVRIKDFMALVVTTETQSKRMNGHRHVVISNKQDAVANHADHYNLILIPTIPPKPSRPFPKNSVIDF